MLLSKPWFRRTCLILLVFLAALPWLVSDITRYLAVDWIEQHGVEKANVETLWINPYTGFIELSGMTLSQQGKTHAFELVRIDLNWWDLWSKKVRVTKLEISGLDLHVVDDHGKRSISGIALPESAAVDDSLPANTDSISSNDTDGLNEWHFAIDSLWVENVDIELHQPQVLVQASIDTLTLSALDTSQNINSELSLLMTLKNLSIEDQQIFASTQLQYSADIDVKKDASGFWSSILTGRTVFENTKISNPEFQATLARFDVGMKKIVDFDESLNYKIDLETKLSTFSLIQNTNTQAVINIDAVSFDSEIGQRSVNVNDFVLSGLDVLPASVTGASNDALVEKASAFIRNVGLSLNRLDMTLPTESNAAIIRVDNVNLTSGDVHLDRRETGDIHQLNRLNDVLSDVQSLLEPPTSKVNEVAAVKSDQASVASSDANTIVESSVEKNPLQLLVNKLSVKSGVTVHFTDASVSPIFTEILKTDFIDIEHITLTEPMAIAMKIDLSYGASIVANAEASAANLSAKGRFDLKSYEILVASAYSEMFTGYALESGKFNLSSDFDLANNQLTSHHEVDIDYLNLRAEHQDSVEQFAHRLTMPLDQAVDLLRDGNDHIHLEVPVNGEVNNPEVNLQQIMNTALKGAMKKASMAVLSALLQPYGAMISIAQMAGEEMTTVRLAPVEFRPGLAELEPSSLDYMEKVGAMMRERSSLDIKLCGVTNAQDNDFLLVEASKTSAGDENPSASTSAPIDGELIKIDMGKMQTLGHERALAVKSHLETTVGVSASQLFMCLPKHLADGSPGVELSI